MQGVFMGMVLKAELSTLHETCKPLPILIARRTHLSISANDLAGQYLTYFHMS